jgi:WhiB family redox-sensing transcriptional regulator
VQKTPSGGDPATAGRGANPVRVRHLAVVPDRVAVPDPEPDPGEPWQDRALCAETDPEAFFPEKGGSTREAKKICLRCGVRDECLDYALEHDERFGIWGGLSERERRRFKHRWA